MANNFNFLLTKASKDDIKTAVDYVFDPFIKALREATLPSGFTYEQTFDRFKTYMKRKFELIGLHDWMELCKLLFDSFGRETPKELNQVIDVQGGCATLVPTARQVFVLFFKVFIGDFDGAKVGWFQMLAKFLEASKPFAIDGIKEYLEKCKKEGDKGISSILLMPMKMVVETIDKKAAKAGSDFNSMAFTPVATAFLDTSDIVEVVIWAVEFPIFSLGYTTPYIFYLGPAFHEHPETEHLSW